MSDPDHTLVLFRRPPSGLDRNRIEHFAHALREKVARADFLCLLTTDAELRRLNCQFRGRDYPTDVLSFASGEGGSLGELAISVPRARAQAAERGHSVEDEIGILMLHGVLHLKGMDHESDAGEMHRQEARWRRKLKLPESLIERVERA